MGFDFTPKNKKAGDLTIGAFTWPIMLDAGIGLPVRAGKGWLPGQFIYDHEQPVYTNDGAKVTATEAGQMAQIADWIADLQEAKLYCFERDEPKDRQISIRAEEQAAIKTNRRSTYAPPWDKKHIEIYRKFAKFARASGGFEIT